MTHTPGPWRVALSAGGTGRPQIVRVVGNRIQDIVVQRDGAISPANAQLIAVAPEMLAALKALTEHMDRAGGDGYGMPECPWCHSQRDDTDNAHDADCELLKARDVLTRAEPEKESK